MKKFTGVETVPLLKDNEQSNNLLAVVITAERNICQNIIDDLGVQMTRDLYVTNSTTGGYLYTPLITLPRNTVTSFFFNDRDGLVRVVFFVEGPRTFSKEIIEKELDPYSDEKTGDFRAFHWMRNAGKQLWNKVVEHAARVSQSEYHLNIIRYCNQTGMEDCYFRKTSDLADERLNGGVVKTHINIDEWINNQHPQMLTLFKNLRIEQENKLT